MLRVHFVPMGIHSDEEMPARGPGSIGEVVHFLVVHLSETCKSGEGTCELSSR